MSKLTGIIEYLPDEYTISAWAGTGLEEIKFALAKQGQYLPFDPPFVASGATLGGTVAAGLSGSQRYRYGGVRDFIIGLGFVDGRGRLVQGGGKVVKNAAGFDLPKLMVGSLGRLGIIVETTFKVFPQPPTYATFQAEYGQLGEALNALTKLTGSQLDLEALDIIPNDDRDNVTIQVRIGGLEAVLPERLAQLQAQLGRGQVVSADVESTLWDVSREFTWLNETSDGPLRLIKIPTTPRQITNLEPHLARANAHAIDATDKDVPIYLGIRKGQALLKRIKNALDPAGQFYSG